MDCSNCSLHAQNFLKYSSILVSNKSRTGRRRFPPFQVFDILSLTLILILTKSTQRNSEQKAKKVAQKAPSGIFQPLWSPRLR